MLTSEQIMVMDHSELKVEIAEKIFKAKVIGKEGHPNDFLLVGHMPHMMPISGRRWQDAWWRDSEEKAWLDIPDYAESISDAWAIVDQLKIQIIPQSDGAPSDMKYLAKIEEDAAQAEISVFAPTAPEAICKAALISTLEV